MIKDNFDNQVMVEIKNRKIFPRPRWVFWLKSFVVWLSGGLAILFGSTSSALLIYLIQSDGVDLHRRAGASPVEIVLMAVPFFWLVASLVFVYLAYFNLKNTDRGYRYSPWLIGAIVFLVSLFAGFVLYGSGLSRTLDNVLGERMPFYEYVANPRIGFWSDQKRGHLLGVITQQADSNTLVLLDRKQRVWLVDISHVNQPVGLLPFDVGHLAGHPVGFWGQKIAEDRFEAQGFLPMRGGEGFLGHPAHLPPPAPR